jgi:hypothetical protein
VLTILIRRLLVGVMLERQLAIGTLDLRRSGILCDTQNLIGVVSWIHSKQSLIDEQ